MESRQLATRSLYNAVFQVIILAKKIRAAITLLKTAVFTLTFFFEFSLSPTWKSFGNIFYKLNFKIVYLRILVF